jgi:hypothetical protein
MASLVFLEGSIGAGKSTVLFELEKKDIPSFKNLWLGPSIFVEFTTTNTGAMHVLALTTHVETITSTAYGQRWSTYGRGRA